jgi:hypothetical protein
MRIATAPSAIGHVERLMGQIMRRRRHYDAYYELIALTNRGASCLALGRSGLLD